MNRRIKSSPLLLARRVYGFWLLAGLALLPGVPQLFTVTRAMGPLWLWLLVLPALCLLLSLVLPAASSTTTTSHPVRHTRGARQMATSRRRRFAQRSIRVNRA